MKACAPMDPWSRLAGDLLHYTVRSLAEHYAKLEVFTTLAAEDLHARGRRRWRAAMYLAAPWTFVSTLLFRLGFPRRLPRRAHRLDLRPLRLDEVPQAGPAGPRAQARTAPLAAGGRRLKCAYC